MSLYCWKCGYIVNGCFCGHCGCRQDTRRDTSSLIGKRLRYAYDHFGTEAFLTNPELFSACVSDLLPDEPELGNYLKALVKAGFGAKMYSLLCKKEESLSSETIEHLKNNMRNFCSVEEGNIDTLLTGLLDMVGIEYNFAGNNSCDYNPIPLEQRNDIHHEISPIYYETNKIIFTLYGVGLSDITFGGSGRPKNGGVIRIYHDHLAFHKYLTAGKFAASLGKTHAGKAAAENAKFQEKVDSKRLLIGVY